MSTPDVVWRLQNNEEAIKDERQERRDAVQRLIETKAEAKDLEGLTDEVRGLRRALVGFSLSMIAGSGMFLLGVLAFVHPT